MLGCEPSSRCSPGSTAGVPALRSSTWLLGREEDEGNSKRKKSRNSGVGRVLESEKWNRLDKYPLFPVQAGVRLESPRAWFILLTVGGAGQRGAGWIEGGPTEEGLRDLTFTVHPLCRGSHVTTTPRGTVSSTIDRWGNQSAWRWGIFAQSRLLKKWPIWISDLALLLLFPFTQLTPGL